MWRCRQATPADEPFLVAGNCALAAETEDLVLDPATVARGVRAGLTETVDATYWLALSATAQPVGQAMVTREWSDWRSGYVWWIQSVYVVPDFRKQGVYRALYQHIVQEAHEQGAMGLRLYVDRRNHRASEVYRQMGMNGDHYELFEAVPLPPVPCT